MTDEANHWDQVYSSKPAGDVSWYQANAGCRSRPSAEMSSRVISPRRAWTKRADASARPHAPSPSWSQDLRTWQPSRTFSVWHDRAVFHFLTSATDRDAYVSTVSAAIEPGGVLVLGTFAEDGPEMCSGLPTARYDAAGLAALFSETFRVERSAREVHRTPWGSEQPFTWIVLRRTGD